MTAEKIFERWQNREVSDIKTIRELMKRVALLDEVVSAAMMRCETCIGDCSTCSVKRAFDRYEGGQNEKAEN